MKITPKRLREIILEEISNRLAESSLEDLEARLSAMDTRRTDDKKKVRYRGTRDDLNEVARALQLMFDVTAAIIQKGTEVFRSRSVYGIPVREQPALKELADIVREYAKHVKAAEGPINESYYNEATENLKIANKTIERMLSEIDELPNERVDTTTRGGPSDAMAVDAFLDGRRSSVMGDPPREELKRQAKWLGRTIETVARNNIIPEVIRDRLAAEVKDGFLQGVYGILGESQLLDMYIDQEMERVISEAIDADWNAAKWKATKKKIRDAAIGAGALGAVAGTLGGQVSDYEDMLAADNAAAIEAGLEKTSTMDKGASEIERLVNAIDSWSWEAGTDKDKSGLDGPLPNNPDNPSEAILPPDWSVAQQALSDKRTGSPQYDVDRDILDSASDEDALAKHYTHQRGNPGTSAETFFQDFPVDTYPFTDASEAGMHAFRSNVPMMPSSVYKDSDGSYSLQNIVYIPFDEIPDDYILPVSGMTKEELYKKYYYGFGSNREEFKKLKASLKENKITWKNYKNRKKLLA